MAEASPEPPSEQPVVLEYSPPAPRANVYLGVGALAVAILSMTAFFAAFFADTALGRLLLYGSAVGGAMAIGAGILAVRDSKRVLGSSSGIARTSLVIGMVTVVMFLLLIAIIYALSYGMST